MTDDDVREREPERGTMVEGGGLMTLVVTQTKLRERFTVAPLTLEGQELADNMVRSEYVEGHWTAYVGPVAVMLARKLDAILSQEPKTAVIVKRLAVELGVEDIEIMRACARLVRFGLAAWSDRDPTLYLARRWPSVPAAISTPQHREALLALDDGVLA